MATVVEGRSLQVNSQLVSKFDILLKKDNYSQRVLWPETVELTTDFFNTLRDHAGPAGPAALGQPGAKGDHGTDGDKEGGAVTNGTEGRGEEGEELLLEDVGELGELLGVVGGQAGRISTALGHIIPRITNFYSNR